MVTKGAFVYANASLNKQKAAPTLHIGKTLVTGPGFDSCMIPSSTSLAAWWNHAPYRWVNAYLGGEEYISCRNTNLTAAWVQTVISQGWSILPTWVGLQAPCAKLSHGAKFSHLISYDTGTAYEQGKSEADQAITVAISLDLPLRSPLFDDIEYFDASNSDCLEAVNAFINGWDQEIVVRSYTSGIYTSGNVASEIAQASITEPEEIWLTGGGNIWTISYDSSCSVFGNKHIPDSYWASHQRIYQYTAGHTETYNGVTLTIDADCADTSLVGIGPIARNFTINTGSSE
jgi:hypothetical protein